MLPRCRPVFSYAYEGTDGGFFKSGAKVQKIFDICKLFGHEKAEFILLLLVRRGSEAVCVYRQIMSRLDYIIIEILSTFPKQVSGNLFHNNVNTVFYKPHSSLNQSTSPSLICIVKDKSPTPYFSPYSIASGLFLDTGDSDS